MSGNDIIDDIVQILADESACDRATLRKLEIALRERFGGMRKYIAGNATADRRRERDASAQPAGDRYVA